MPRLSAAPGYAGGLLAAAVAVWWLAGLHTQAGIGFPQAAAASATATTFLILGQWLLLVVMLPLWHRLPTARTSASAALTVSAPVWPLLVMLWAAGGAAAWKLLATQAFAFALAGIVSLLLVLISRLPLPGEPHRVLGQVCGLALAAGIWMQRSAIGRWLEGTAGGTAP